MATLENQITEEENKENNNFWSNSALQSTDLTHFSSPFKNCPVKLVKQLLNTRKYSWARSVGQEINTENKKLDMQLNKNLPM